MYVIEKTRKIELKELPRTCGECPFYKETRECFGNNDWGSYPYCDMGYMDQENDRRDWSFKRSKYSKCKLEKDMKEI